MWSDPAFGFSAKLLTPPRLLAGLRDEPYPAPAMPQDEELCLYTAALTGMLCDTPPFMCQAEVERSLESPRSLLAPDTSVPAADDDHDADDYAASTDGTVDGLVPTTSTGFQRSEEEGYTQPPDAATATQSPTGAAAGAAAAVKKVPRFKLSPRVGNTGGLAASPTSSPSPNKASSEDSSMQQQPTGSAEATGPSLLPVDEIEAAASLPPREASEPAQVPSSGSKSKAASVRPRLVFGKGGKQPLRYSSPMGGGKQPHSSLPEEEGSEGQEDDDEDSHTKTIDSEHRRLQEDDEMIAADAGADSKAGQDTQVVTAMGGKEAEEVEREDEEEPEEQEDEEDEEEDWAEILSHEASSPDASCQTSDARRCIFCHAHGDRPVEGLLLYAGIEQGLLGGWAHANCAMWSAETYESSDPETRGYLMDVQKAASRGKLATCEYCDQPY